MAIKQDNKLSYLFTITYTKINFIFKVINLQKLWVTVTVSFVQMCH